jgi:tetratricopeptide (TPR) repeat protein
MPSHVYVRTGQYEKAIATNERSLAADKEFLRQWGNHPFPQTGTYFLSAINHGPHAVDFIRYAASVQGNYERAIAAARAGRSVATPWMMHKMFGQWEALRAEERRHNGRPYIDGIWFYVQGSSSTAQGDFDSAQSALAKLQDLQSPGLELIRARINPVSTLLQIAALGLDGEIKQARGELSGAIESFEKAVYLEDRLSYIEPPDWAQPMRHYLGAALLEAGRAAEAEQVYRRDLAWNRGNGWSLYGLWLSVKAQGRIDEALAIHNEFEVAWKNADVTLSASRF